MLYHSTDITFRVTLSFSRLWETSVERIRISWKLDRLNYQSKSTLSVYKTDESNPLYFIADIPEIVSFGSAMAVLSFLSSKIIL